MKAKKVGVIAKGKMMRSVVFSGSKTKTSTGLTKGDLMKNKRGKIVTKASSLAGKKAYRHISSWTAALKKARAELKVKGFVACKKGSPLYKKAKELRAVSGGKDMRSWLCRYRLVVVH